MLEKGCTIRIAKIEAVPDAPNATADWKDYIAGETNSLSPPLNYTIEGLLLYEPEKGRPFFVARTKRNGVDAFGFFQTSPVSNIIEITSSLYRISTNNSVYMVSVLKNKKEV